ncbi:MAG: hypothetical protein GY847_17675 [Proteobacteria bacterium]|nr:hypothetical protein [Pseudomonadota bacterium]
MMGIATFRVRKDSEIKEKRTKKSGLLLKLRLMIWKNRVFLWMIEEVLKKEGEVCDI